VSWGKRPTVGMPGESARFCGEHHEVGMVNVKNKMRELCDKQPTFGMPGESGLGCLSHSSHVLLETFTMPTSRCSPQNRAFPPTWRSWAAYVGQPRSQ